MAPTCTRCSGSAFAKAINTCSCRDGRWDCTHVDCPGLTCGFFIDGNRDAAYPCDAGEFDVGVDAVDAVPAESGTPDPPASDARADTDDIGAFDGDGDGGARDDIGSER